MTEREPAARPGMTAARRATILVSALLAVLTIALTWPLIAHLTTRLPGTATWAFDESTFGWNIWYFKHALIDLGVSPLHSELIWYPLGIDLILYTFNFFNALIGLPLLLAVNVPFANNITLLLATMLSGLGAYLLAVYVLRRAGVAIGAARRGAFVAAVVYAFASNRAIYAALGHYNFMTTQWLPFYALYLLKTLRQRSWRNAAWAGVFFALAAVVEMTFASLLAQLTFVTVVVCWRGLRARWLALARLALAMAIAVALWSPVLILVAREFVSGDYALEGWGEGFRLSADLAGLLTPTALNPVARASAGINPLDSEAALAYWTKALRAVEEGKSRFSDINTFFVGWVTLALALLGGWLGRRKLAVWNWTALLFGILSLGPLLQINGRYRFSLDGLLPEGVTFPLPFALLHYLPFVNANRTPNRNGLLVMLALAVLAGYGAWWLLEMGRRGGMGTRGQGGGETRRRLAHQATKLPSYLATSLLAVLIILEHLAIPLPTTDARIPAVYQQIAQEPGEFAIMQLPLGWRNSFGVLGSEQTNLQYFQTGHGKPMVGGNISRAPDSKMAYFARIPLFKALTDLEMYRPLSPDLDAAARSQAADLMALYDVRYLVTTPPIPGRYPYQDTWAATEAYALDVLPVEPQPVWSQDGYTVYRVQQPAVAFPFRVDLGTPGTEPYLAAGWDLAAGETPYGATASWVTQTRAEAYLPLAAPRPVTVRIAIAPLAYDAAPAQTLTIRVNGQRVLVDWPLAEGWQTVTADVPAEATRRGPNRVTLTLAWAASPRVAFPDAASRAVIGATGQVSPVNLEAHGFTEAFISAFDAHGQEVKASTSRRGYNVAVFDARSGDLLDQQGFDTAANRYEADALAAYLASIPAGRIVALATREDATAHLTPAALSALAGLGSRVTAAADLAGQAHALIGVQGAAPGAAAEAIQPGDAFVRVGGDFRTLAAAVDWLELGE